MNQVFIDDNVVTSPITAEVYQKYCLDDVIYYRGLESNRILVSLPDDKSGYAGRIFILNVLYKGKIKLEKIKGPFESNFSTFYRIITNHANTNQK